MRKLFLIIATLFVATSVQAHKKVYCQITVTSKIAQSKVNISIDFGQESKTFDNDTLVDADGKPIEFNSLVDALNYLGERGWDFEQAYQVPSNLKGEPPMCRYLLSKVIDGDESENGFVTKSQYKAAHKNKHKQ